MSTKRPANRIGRPFWLFTAVRECPDCWRNERRQTRMYTQKPAKSEDRQSFEFIPNCPCIY